MLDRLAYVAKLLALGAALMVVLPVLAVAAARAESDAEDVA
jgi:hypothetical protein